MSFIKKCYSLIELFLNEEKKELALNRKAVQQYLFKYIKITSLSLTLSVTFVILMVTTILPIFNYLAVPYLAPLLVGSVFNLLTIFVLKKRPHLSLFFYYCFFTLVFICSVFVIIYADKFITTPIMYCLAILVFASFALDKCIRVFSYIIIITILSTFFIYIFGYPSINSAHSIISISSSSLIACMFALSIRRTILKMLEIERVTKLERNIDSLTTLPNRRTLFESIIEAEKELKRPYTGAIMLDIDHFKIFNDSYGHQKGDNVLKQIGCFLKDFAFDFDFSAFRYGGEEFLLLSDKYDENQLKDMANRIVGSASQLKIPFLAVQNKILTFSAGYAVRSDEINYEKLISKADEALYYSKTSGRNKATGYSDIHHSQKPQRKRSLRNTDRELSE